MNFKLLLRMIGRTVGFVCIIVWIIIFTMAFIRGNDRVVRVTIRADVFHEFWFEFILLSIGLVGFTYDYLVCRKSMGSAKKDRETITEIKEPTSD